MTKPLYYRRHLCSPPLISSIFITAADACSARRSSEPPSASCDADHSHAYLSQSNAETYAVMCTIRRRGRRSATRILREMLQPLQLHGEGAAYCESDRSGSHMVPVGHLPTLGKASSTTVIYTLWPQERMCGTVRAGGIVSHVSPVVKRVQRIALSGENEIRAERK